MLLAVLVFYLRMVNARQLARRRQSQLISILEKAEIFESAGDDRSALNEIESALNVYSDHPQFKEKREELISRVKGGSP